ncbi:MAG: GNAT family N-acetyltransferase [Chlamydiales bacterium]|nr:GNAT family N-acetyltransferase [Chlamydiales bacterium]
MTRPLPPARIEYKDLYVLRPVEPGDIPQIEEALEASLSDLRRFMSWAHHPLGREGMLERVLNQHALYFKGKEYELALFDKKTGAFLVYTGFYPTNRINPFCMEIGYWVSSLNKGKGLATLATRIQIALLFEYFKSDRVEITCSTENHASLRVIEKCGFHLEGELRNFYPKGNPRMYADGFTKERGGRLFSLVPEERPNLPWYREIVDNVVLFPLLERPQFLSHAQ